MTKEKRWRVAGKVLTNYEKGLVEAIAETLIPTPYGPLTKSVKDVHIAERVDDHLACISLDARITYRIFLLVMEWGAILYKFRLARFTKMSAERRSEYLGAWHRTWWSPKRLISRFIEAVINMNYYSDPEVGKECGYEPRFEPPATLPELPKDRLFSTPLEGDHTEDVDVCVIGSGAGGSAAAWALSEQGRSVVVLEEGGWFSAKDYGKDAVTMTRMLYRNGGLINTFGWPNILVPLGQCVGGTTLINSGTCFRCPNHVFLRWMHEYGLSSFQPDRMRPYFDRVEKMLGQEIPSSDLLGHNVEVFARGLKALGHKGAPITRNTKGCKASGVCAFGCPTNAKRGADLTFIPRALENGARVYAHCRAERIVRQKRRVEEVVASFIDPTSGRRIGRLRVKAKIVIVACGTLHTPLLLKRSGMPNPSGQIGRNLTLHPAAKVVALFDEEIRAWKGIPQGYYVDDLASEGIKLEEIFIPPAFTASSFMFSGKQHCEAMANYNRLAGFGFMVSDTSRGRIFRIPPNYAVTWYSVNRTDLPKYLRGIAFLAEVFFAAGAKKVFPGVYKVPVITREEGVEKLYTRKVRPKDLDLQAFHPLGTCRMGVDPKESATDPNGRLYGIDNVYIADGSIFPTSLGVNPQVTIMAAAAKIGDYIHRECL